MNKCQREHHLQIMRNDDADNACFYSSMWPEEYRMMFARNHVIKQELKAGNPVQFRCWGFCLHPWVCDGDCCIFEPVVCLSSLRRGDIVFCHVQTRNRCYVRLVWQKYEHQIANGTNKTCYIIGNNRDGHKKGPMEKYTSMAQSLSKPEAREC